MGAMPEEVAGLTISQCKTVNAPKIVFSAMDASVATEIEQEFAKAGRADPDMPLPPEIAMVLYYACAGLALLRHGQWITTSW